MLNHWCLNLISQRKKGKIANNTYSCLQFIFLFLWFYKHRPWAVLHQDTGGSQPRPSGGSTIPVGSAHWWELGPQRQQEDVALREQPLPHHHHQICTVPGLLIPGVFAGQWVKHIHTRTTKILQWWLTVEKPKWQVSLRIRCLNGLLYPW